jgi:hypothetical protein
VKYRTKDLVQLKSDLALLILGKKPGARGYEIQSHEFKIEVRTKPQEMAQY